MRDKPPIQIGLIASLVIGAATFGVLAMLVDALRSQTIGLGLAFSVALLVLALVLGGLWLHGLIELLSLRYIVDRNGVVIRTAFARQTIPHSAIRRLAYGEPVTPQGRIRGLSWPGYTRGEIAAAPYGRIAIWGTEPLDRLLYLVADGTAYAISPSDPEGFIQRYAMRRELGALEAMPEELRRVGIAAFSVWGDRVFWIVTALASALDAALATFAVSRYGDLPSIIAMHWNAQGQADRLTGRSSLFAIPAIGTTILAINLVLGTVLHHRERPIARLLAWGSVAVQLALWAAAWQILGT